jgi:hypothetical protein
VVIVSAARWLSLALIGVGLTAGTAVDTHRATPPARAGNYYILAADFHVHAFPGDGALPAWALAREASRRGLHAIVVSNHNQTLAAKILPGLFSAALVIPSQEITTPRFHLVAAGISRTIDWRKPALDIVRDVHEQGGVVIAAHPVGRYWRTDDAMLEALDGVEVAHPLTTMLATGRDELTAFFTRTRAVNADVAPIGSSDFHMVAPLGVCRTYVFAESVSVKGVLDAIRAGRTVAQDQDGVLYGAPELTASMDAARVASAVPPVGRRVKLAGLIVLLGFLAIVVLR